MDSWSYSIQNVKGEYFHRDHSWREIEVGDPIPTFDRVAVNLILSKSLISSVTGRPAYLTRTKFTEGDRRVDIKSDTIKIESLNLEGIARVLAEV